MARQSVFCQGRAVGHRIYRVIFMVETLLGVLASVLMVAGAVSVIKWAALKIAASGSDGKRVYAVLLDGNDADIRLQMMIQTLQWENALYGVKAFAIDGGLDFEMAEYCRMICEKSRVTYLKPEDVKDLKSILFE